MSEAFLEGKIDQKAKEIIKQTIEAVEDYEKQKKIISEQIKEVFDHAKGQGLDTKILKDVLKLRKMTFEQRQEKEFLLDIYKDATGMNE